MRQIARLTDEDLNLDALIRTYAGRGSKPHRPDLLLKLMIYEHSQGRPQPVQWMKDLEENKAVQWLVYGMRPSQTTLYEFRDRVQPLLQDLNQQVIRTAIDEGHTDGSRGALDGTTVAANATRHRMVNLDTVEKRLEILDREIREAEQAEEPTPAIESAEPEVLPSPTAPMAEGSTPLPAPMPESPAKPPAWKAKTTRGKKRQRDRCRRAKKVLEAQHAANKHRRKDKRKGNAKIRVALGDPMAPFGLDKTENLPSALQYPDDERRGDRLRARVRDNPNHRRQRPVAAHDRADDEDDGSAAEGSARGLGLSQWRGPGGMRAERCDRLRAVEREHVHGGEASKGGKGGPNPQGSVYLTIHRFRATAVRKASR